MQVWLPKIGILQLQGTNVASHTGMGWCAHEAGALPEQNLCRAGRSKMLLCQHLAGHRSAGWAQQARNE